VNIAILANLTVFALTLAWLVRRYRAGTSLSSNVLIALVIGIVLGAALQALYGIGSPTLTGTLAWVNIVGGGYVRLLQMIVVPLVFVSILAAVTRLSDARTLGAISAGVLGLLMITTAVSAMIGIGVT
jgi:uncharacterized protein